MVTAVHRIETLHADRVASPKRRSTHCRRRFSGRYALDPFGLDSQIADTLIPVLNTLVRVTVLNGEHVPVDGAAVIVSNRGFGLAEPTAARAGGEANDRPAPAGRRRAVGTVHWFGVAPDRRHRCERTRRHGRVPRRASRRRPARGNVVAHRRGCGAAALAQAMTHNPIVPAAVKPIGRFGGVIGSWQVRFGSLVTLPEAYEPDDPLAAARFLRCHAGRRQRVARQSWPARTTQA